MSFEREFRDLDPDRMERAFANVSETLYLIAGGGADLAQHATNIFQRVEEASPGYMALIGRQEEAVQMMNGIPGVEYSREWFQMIQMNLGALSVGVVLAEYARLESEET